MLVKIKFHGVLKKLCPKIYEIDATTPIEAIRGLTNQLKQLVRKDGTRFSCVVKECPTKDILTSTFGDIEELNIYPSFIASGGGGKGMLIATIAVGAVLVVVSGGALAGAALAWWSLSTAASYAAAAGLIIGAGMLMSGLSAMLTPVPKVDNQKEEKESKFFSSNKNTTAIGTRIPVVYGRNKIYGQLLSFNLQASDREGYGSNIPQESGIIPPALEKKCGLGNQFRRSSFRP